MVAIAEEPLVRGYDDGPDVPLDNMAKEREFRRGFLESVRHIVCVWAHPPEPEKPRPGPVSVAELLANRRCDPDAEEEAAWKQRGRLRERFAVYGRGDAGAKTYHLGFRPGHVLAAARLRGRHHAMVYVSELWRDLETADLDIYDPKLLCPWLRAVEHWASKPIRPGMATPPPPRVMEVAGPIEDPAEHDPAPETTTSSPPEKAPSTSPAASLTTSSPPPRIRLTRADQIETRPPYWLLRGILEKDTLALIFGDPGCGKSFLAIDWACRIATGTPWRGHGVKGGSVVYVAGEGQQGFGRRIRAWSQHHGVSLTNAPLYLAPAVAIPNDGELLDLIAAIEQTAGDPSLIVLDTLARCFGGGDENSTQDMSNFVTACDAIRHRYHCSVLVVHHAGHGDKSRARGAIALKAALDAEYRLENEGGMFLTATKMKDAEMPPPLAMKLVSVEVPDMKDEDGNPVTSAAIELLDPETSAIVAQAKSAKPKEYGKWQALGLEVARRLISEGDDGQTNVKLWHAACEAAGMQQSTRYDVLAKLRAKGALELNGEALSSP